jgi:hypothetical protein
VRRGCKPGDVTRPFTNSEQTEWNLLQEHSFAYAGCNHFASPRFLLDALPSPALRSLLTVGTCFDRSWGGVMPRPITQIPSSVSALRRALELWPYVLIAVSVAGLATIALNAVR